MCVVSHSLLILSQTIICTASVEVCIDICGIQLQYCCEICNCLHSHTSNGQRLITSLQQTLSTTADKLRSESGIPAQIGPAYQMKYPCRKLCCVNTSLVHVSGVALVQAGWWLPPATHLLW